MSDLRLQKKLETVLRENAELKARLLESEETLNAIRNGEVDAILVSGKNGDKVFSLTSAETPYRIILEEMDEGAVTINTSGIILYGNPGFARIVSLPPGQIPGSDFAGLIPECDGPKFHMLIRNCLKRRSKEVFNTIIKGRQFYLQLSCVRLPAEIEGDICIIVSDITELRNYQDHLQQMVEERTMELEKANNKMLIDYDNLDKAKKLINQSEQRFHSILDNSQDVIYRLNLQTSRFEYISPACKNVIGYSAEELMALDQKTTMSMIHPADLNKFKITLNSNVRPGKLKLVYRQLNSTGEYRWLSNNSTIITDNNGRPLYRDGNIRDITDQLQTKDRLKKSLDKLNIALENGNIGTWECDLATDSFLLDERCEIILGLIPGTFGKTYSAFENCVHEEDLAHLREAINQTRELGLPLETVFRTKPEKDDYHYISTKALVIKDDFGKPLKMSGVCFDISSMKKGTEKTIIKLNEELLRSNKDLQEFAYVASHDLQEPLRMVSSFTQLLEKKYADKLDQAGRDYIKFAVDGSTRMYSQLNGLLQYSRIHSKGREFTKVNLALVLDDVIKNLKLLIKEKNAAITIRKLPWVFADKEQMLRLIQNLIENSLKFNTGTPKISISSRIEREYFVIIVKDNGIGIEPQYFERIFKIFQRLNQREDYAGTGIGLAICKRIVERHGGRIWVKSRLGKGTSFFFSISKYN